MEHMKVQSNFECLNEKEQVEEVKKLKSIVETGRA